MAYRREIEQAFIELHESALGMKPKYELDQLSDDHLLNEMVKLIALMDEKELGKLENLGL